MLKMHHYCISPLWTWQCVAEGMQVCYYALLSCCSFSLFSLRYLTVDTSAEITSKDLIMP